MPTYEYVCEGKPGKNGKPAGCGYHFEQFQSMSAEPLKKCPKCGKSTLKRLIGTGAAVLFKGSGFYQTDYRSDAYKKSAEAESKPVDAKAKTETASSGGGGGASNTSTEPSQKASATSSEKPTESAPANSSPTKILSKPSAGRGASRGGRGSKRK